VNGSQSTYKQAAVFEYLKVKGVCPTFARGFGKIIIGLRGNYCIFQNIIL
jgi:hypothetical protein